MSALAFSPDGLKLAAGDVSKFFFFSRVDRNHVLPAPRALRVSFG